MITLFVYGTLQQGYWNHERFIGGSELLGHGRTVAKYTMCGQGFPLIVSDRYGLPVTGEVYKFDPGEGRLDQLDRLESLYHRVRNQILLDDGSLRWAHYYVVRQGGQYFMPNRHWVKDGAYTWREL